MLSTVIVTGGSGVLGSAIARALYPSAAAVCLVSRRQQPLQAAAEAIGPNAVALPCEITDEKSVERMFADAAARTGRPVGLLVNCAGTMAGGPTTEMSAQTFRDVLDVNVVGSFICAREAFKVMAASGGGRVINAVGVIHPGNVESELIPPEERERRRETEGYLAAEDVAASVLHMASLPLSASVLEMTVLPTQQPFVGRG